MRTTVQDMVEHETGAPRRIASLSVGVVLFKTATRNTEPLAIESALTTPSSQGPDRAHGSRNNGLDFSIAALDPIPETAARMFDFLE